MREISFILPGLDLPQEYLLFAAALPQWDVPTLDNWRRCAHREQVDFDGGSLMAQTFCGSLKAKIARDLDVAEDTPCFLAAPVSQHMDLHSMQLISGGNLPLSWTDAHTLCNSLNDLLAENHCRCHVFRPDLWLMTCPHTWDWYAPDIWSLAGRADVHSKISCQDAAVLLKMLTEMQMLLFAHPLNQTREAAGLPPVNGVWLWPDTNGRAADEAAVAGAVSWLPEGQYLWQTVDYSWAELQNFAADRPHLMIYDDRAHNALATADLAAHTAFLQNFDREILHPAHQALRAGDVAHCRIVAEKTVLHMSAARRFCFWRRYKPYRGVL